MRDVEESDLVCEGIHIPRLRLCFVCDVRCLRLSEDMPSKMFKVLEDLPSLSLRVNMDQDIYDILQKQLRFLRQTDSLRRLRLTGVYIQ